MALRSNYCKAFKKKREISIFKLNVLHQKSIKLFFYQKYQNKSLTFIVDFNFNQFYFEHFYLAKKGWFISIQGEWFWKNQGP